MAPAAVLDTEVVFRHLWWPVHAPEGLHRQTTRHFPHPARDQFAWFCRSHEALWHAACWVVSRKWAAFRGRAGKRRQCHCASGAVTRRMAVLALSFDSNGPRFAAETEAGVASIANVWRGLATVHKHVVRQCLKAECLLRWQGQCKLMCRVRQALQSIVWAPQQTHCMCSAPAQMISTCCGAHALLSMGCVWPKKVWKGCLL